MESNQAEQALAEILAQDEYQIYYQDNRNILQIIWDRIKEWIGDLLARWLSSFEPSSSVGDAIIAILLLIGVILAVVLLFILGRNMMQKRTLRSLKPLQSISERDWGSVEHFAESLRLEQHGIYQQATRHLFLGLLLTLHEWDWLVAQQWKTNWEYYQDLQKKKKERSESFYKFALFFEEVTYGEKEIAQVTYQAYKIQINSWLERYRPTDTTDERVGGS